jgi:hypothetical protein
MIIDSRDNLLNMVSILLDYIPKNYTVRNKKVVADITYIGYSTPGTSSASENWFIKRIDDASEEFIRISNSGSWDNVESLNYI